jgi:hypothetical protein
LSRGETLHEILPQAPESSITFDLRADAFNSLAGDLNAADGSRLGTQDVQPSALRFEAQYGWTRWLAVGTAVTYGSDRRLLRLADGTSQSEQSDGLGGARLLSRWRIPVGLTTLVRSRLDLSLPTAQAVRARTGANRQPAAPTVDFDIGVETLWNGFNWGLTITQIFVEKGEVISGKSGADQTQTTPSKWVPGARGSVEIPVDDGLVAFLVDSIWYGDGAGQLVRLVGLASYQIGVNWEVVGGGGYSSWLNTESLGGRTSLNGVSFELGLRKTWDLSPRLQAARLSR